MKDVKRFSIHNRRKWPLMDAEEKLVSCSEIAAAVVGRAGDFALFVLTDNGPLDMTAMEAAHAKGYGFVGVMALINGHVAVKCEPDFDSLLVMVNAAVPFASLVADRLKQPKGDSADWLRRLFELPDARHFDA